MDGDVSIMQWMGQRLDAAKRGYDFESRIFYRRWEAVEGILDQDFLTERQVSAIDRASASATWAVQDLVEVRRLVWDYFDLVCPMPEELLKELARYKNVIDAESRDIRGKHDTLRNARTSLVRKIEGYERAKAE